MRKSFVILITVMVLCACGGDQKQERQRRPSAIGKYVYSEIKFKDDFQFAILHSRMDCGSAGGYGVMPVEVDDFRAEKAYATNFSDCGQVTFCPHCFTESLYQQFLEAGYDMYETPDDSLR